MESSWIKEIEDGAKEVVSSTQASQLDPEKLGGKDFDRVMVLPWDIARG